MDLYLLFMLGLITFHKLPGVPKNHGKLYQSIFKLFIKVA